MGGLEGASGGVEGCKYPETSTHSNLAVGKV